MIYRVTPVQSIPYTRSNSEEKKYKDSNPKYNTFEEVFKKQKQIRKRGK